MSCQATIDDGHVRYVTVNLTDECNLDCRYCFSHEYRCGKHMSPETAHMFAEWFASQAKSGEYAVTFFGGEPFIKADLMPIIVNAISENKKPNTNFSFSATSNGTLIRPEHSKLLRENKISVMVSTDGDRPIHNQNRVDRSGKGSFDDFLKGLATLQAVQKKVTARVTFTPDTVGSLIENHEALLFKYGLTSVAASPVTEAPWDQASLDEYEKQLFGLAGLLLEKWKSGEFISLRILEKPILEIMLGDTKGKIRYPCGAGRTTAGVGIDGKIYPCHRFVGMDEYIIGTLETGIRPSDRSSFWEAPVKTGMLCNPDQGCDNCDLKFACRGECYQVAFETTGSIKEPSKAHYLLSQKSLHVAGCLIDYLLEEEPHLLEKILGLETDSLQEAQLKYRENYC